MRRAALVLVLVVFSLPGIGAAQITSPDALKKLPDVHITVEDIDEEAATKCGVTRSGLDAAVRLPIDASRLGVKK